MRCPYCLTTSTAPHINAQTGSYECPNCRSVLPKGYIEHKKVPRATVGVVGFSGHGKTVYLTSLFSELSKLSNHWQGYYFRCLDDYTHRILYEQVPLFQSGVLPDSTPANFPSPSLIKYANIPGYSDAYLGYYDTAGEVFNDADNITRTGYFVAHADAILFILSIPDCTRDSLDDDLSRLLDTYIRAVEDYLKITLKEHQELIVILTKGDLIPNLPHTLQDWLNHGGMASYLQPLTEHRLELNYISMTLESWLREDLQCNRFVNMAYEYFKEVRFTIVSSTGRDKDGKQNSWEPLRVLAPFIWVLEFCVGNPETKSPRRGLFKKIFGRK